MNVNINSEFIKSLQENGGSSKKVLSMCILLRCLPSLFRPEPFSEKGNDLGPSGG